MAYLFKDKRISKLIKTLTQFAALDFGARRTIEMSGRCDDVEAMGEAVVLLGEHLQSLNDQTSALMASHPGMIFWLNSMGVVYRANQKAADLLGYSLHELAQFRLSELMTPDRSDLGINLEMSIGGEPLTLQTTLFDRRGKPRPVTMELFALRSTDGFTEYQAVAYDRCAKVIHVFPENLRYPAMETVGAPTLLPARASLEKDIAIAQYKLTQRELDIIGLMAEGKASREIAEILNVNFRTIETQRDRLYAKLGVTKATSLIQKANQLCLTSGN